MGVLRSRMSGTHTNFSSVVGITNYKVDRDRVIVSLPVEEKHLNQIGLVHGGVLATLADNSMGMACFLACQTPTVTVEFKLSFMRPARGGVLHATSKVVKMGEHLAFVDCDISDEKGTTIAKALGTYMIVGKRT